MPYYELVYSYRSLVDVRKDTFLIFFSYFLDLFSLVGLGHFFCH